MQETKQPEIEEFINLVEVLYSTLNFLRIDNFKNEKDYHNNDPFKHRCSRWVSYNGVNEKFNQYFKFELDRNNVLVKEGINLYPVTLEISFVLDIIFSNKKVEQKYNFSNNLDNNFVELAGHNSKIKLFLNKEELKFCNNLKWQAYIKEDREYDTLFFHFPEFDTWITADSKRITDHTSVFVFSSNNDVAVVDQDSFSYTPSDFSNFSGLTHNCHDNGFTDKELIEYSNEDVLNEVKISIDLFKENQNDPFFDPELMENKELEFLSGSEEELERLIKIICYAGIPMQVWDTAGISEFYVNVKSATDDEESAIVDFDSMDWNEEWSKIKKHMPNNFIDKIEYFFDIALSQNTPSGHSWEYNDGAYDRQSGYDKTNYSLDFLISYPSAHEQIGAKVELMKLNNIFGKRQIDEFLNLTNVK